MASPTLPDGQVAYEPFTLPDDGYRESLLGLLSAQAAPMWSVGQQAAYQAHVMAGASLEHWVRTSGVWSEVERNIWELNGLLAHLDVESWEALDGARTASQPVEQALEGWVDLLLVELVVDNLGAAMARACERSSYAPLARTARLLAYGKTGSYASGVVGLREILANDQVPRDQLAERAAVWQALGRTLAEHFAEAQQADRWEERGLSTPLDAAAVAAESTAELNRLLEAAP
ncbi:MAG TPA: hypothetical protein VHW47_06735 [Acidimicrobiales bacterium]|jgi:hypothetical protein|nr:hypothetical protein [Acidimicrobiales bacterium]